MLFKTNKEAYTWGNNYVPKNGTIQVDMEKHSGTFTSHSMVWGTYKGEPVHLDCDSLVMPEPETFEDFSLLDELAKEFAKEKAVFFIENAVDDYENGKTGPKFYLTRSELLKLQSWTSLFEDNPAMIKRHLLFSKAWSIAREEGVMLYYFREVNERGINTWRITKFKGKGKEKWVHDAYPWFALDTLKKCAKEEP